MIDRQATAELAAQIVFEYPNWGCEHVHDMHATYKQTGEEPPCSEDELWDACNDIQLTKNTGRDIDECIEMVVEIINENYVGVGR